MNRINVVDVSELSDQHLIEEYRKLPRVIKQNIDISNAPKQYCLGKGHIKWAKLYSRWIMRRYLDITWELQNRGFRTNYPFYKLYEIYETQYYNKNCDNWYEVKEEDIQLNKQRIIERYRSKPDFYRWTNSNKPDYLKGGDINWKK